MGGSESFDKRRDFWWQRRPSRGIHEIRIGICSQSLECRAHVSNPGKRQMHAIQHRFVIIGAVSFCLRRSDCSSGRHIHLRFG